MQGKTSERLRPTDAYFFATCHVDLLRPEAGIDAIALIEREGFSVHDARPGVAPMVGQGAAKRTLMNGIWASGVALYSRPSLYSAFGWLATRLRFLTPQRKSGWTLGRTPLKPDARSLRDLLAE